MASVPSTPAIVIIHQENGIRMKVRTNIAEIIAATIRVPNLPTTRLMLFFKSTERPQMMSLAISATIQPATNPIIEAIK